MSARSLLSADGCFEDVSYQSAVAVVSIALNHTVAVRLLFLVSLYSAIICHPKHTSWTADSICKWKIQLHL